MWAATSFAWHLTMSLRMTTVPSLSNWTFKTNTMLVSNAKKYTCVYIYILALSCVPEELRGKQLCEHQNKWRLTFNDFVEWLFNSTVFCDRTVHYGSKNPYGEEMLQCPTHMKSCPMWILPCLVSRELLWVLSFRWWIASYIHRHPEFEHADRMVQEEKTKKKKK